MGMRLYEARWWRPHVPDLSLRAWRTQAHITPADALYGFHGVKAEYVGTGWQSFMDWLHPEHAPHKDFYDLAQH